MKEKKRSLYGIAYYFGNSLSTFSHYSKSLPDPTPRVCPSIPLSPQTEKEKRAQQLKVLTEEEESEEDKAEEDRVARAAGVKHPAPASPVKSDAGLLEEAQDQGRKEQYYESPIPKG